MKPQYGFVRHAPCRPWATTLPQSTALTYKGTRSKHMQQQLLHLRLAIQWLATRLALLACQEFLDSQLANYRTYNPDPTQVEIWPDSMCEPRLQQLLVVLDRPMANPYGL
eukprot:834888-Amphidinium_carterae.3